MHKRFNLSSQQTCKKLFIKLLDWFAPDPVTNRPYVAIDPWSMPNCVRR